MGEAGDGGARGGAGIQRARDRGLPRGGFSIGAAVAAATGIDGAAKSGRTDCPGRYFNIAQVRSMATRMAAAEDAAFQPREALARGELLFDF